MTDPMRNKATYLLVGVLAMLSWAAPLSAQKAGQITKATSTGAFLDRPLARPTATQKVSEIVAAPATRID